MDLSPGPLTPAQALLPGAPGMFGPSTMPGLGPSTMPGMEAPTMGLLAPPSITGMNLPSMPGMDQPTAMPAMDAMTSPSIQPLDGMSMPAIDGASAPAAAVNSWSQDEPAWKVPRLAAPKSGGPPFQQGGMPPNMATFMETLKERIAMAKAGALPPPPDTRSWGRPEHAGPKGGAGKGEQNWWKNDWKQPQAQPLDEKGKLVQQVKNWKRRGEEYKQSWYNYCKQLGTPNYDPNRHEIPNLGRFMDEMQALEKTLPDGDTSIFATVYGGTGILQDLVEPQPNKPPQALPAEAQPGDWLCPKCHDLQFARNLTCRMCGASKPDADGASSDQRQGPVLTDPQLIEFAAKWKLHAESQRLLATISVGAQQKVMEEFAPRDTSRDVNSVFMKFADGKEKFLARESGNRGGSFSVASAPPAPAPNAAALQQLVAAAQAAQLQQYVAYAQQIQQAQLLQAQAAGGLGAAQTMQQAQMQQAQLQQAQMQQAMLQQAQLQQAGLMPQQSLAAAPGQMLLPGLPAASPGAPAQQFGLPGADGLIPGTMLPQLPGPDGTLPQLPGSPGTLTAAPTLPGAMLPGADGALLQQTPGALATFPGVDGALLQHTPQVATFAADPNALAAAALAPVAALPAPAVSVADPAAAATLLSAAPAIG
jgi:hypothetical protein